MQYLQGERPCQVGVRISAQGIALRCRHPVDVRGWGGHDRVRSDGVTGFPIAFIIVALLLALFAVGYVAMSRHVTNAGAFYTYVTHGLGKPVGVAAAWVALLAYSALQIGLYGIIHAAVEPKFAGSSILSGQSPGSR